MTKGRASACGAGTIINAIATWNGSAFAIDLRTTAEVELSEGANSIRGEILGGDVDTTLIERCVKLVLDRFDYDGGARVRTSSEIPIARGLKSSSAAANATVLATLDALGEKMEPLETIRLGVQAAFDAGVTITGAFDDAAASYLGGIVATDNREQLLVKRVERESEVLVFVPESQAFTAETNVVRSRLIGPWVDIAYDLALGEEFEKAMTLNGFLYCSALGFDPEPMLCALEAGATGVSLSGTGPAFTAIVCIDDVDDVIKAWKRLKGKTIRTEIDNTGARVESC
ncbi:MAG: shikimate kinase [Methanocellales archaeon]|nr:shikimate kinase [Methanocellales archaeon]MDD3292259.1 shikimate kinase [Methanocellales archaeon]MDD5235965.1 shikimate kinase [Methanocellales archaeon]MDD5484875.1 shikimate kinase [Methanocellales archaeon]